MSLHFEHTIEQSWELRDDGSLASDESDASGGGGFGEVSIVRRRVSEDGDMGGGGALAESGDGRAWIGGGIDEVHDHDDGLFAFGDIAERGGFAEYVHPIAQVLQAVDHLGSWHHLLVDHERQRLRHGGSISWAGGELKT